MLPVFDPFARAGELRVIEKILNFKTVHSTKHRIVAQHTRYHQLDFGRTLQQVRRDDQARGTQALYQSADECLLKYARITFERYRALSLVLRRPLAVPGFWASLPNFPIHTGSPLRSGIFRSSTLVASALQTPFSVFHRNQTGQSDLVMIERSHKAQFLRNNHPQSVSKFQFTPIIGRRSRGKWPTPQLPKCTTRIVTHLLS